MGLKLSVVGEEKADMVKWEDGEIVTKTGRGGSVFDPRYRKNTFRQKNNRQ